MLVLLIITQNNSVLLHLNNSHTFPNLSIFRVAILRFHSTFPCNMSFNMSRISDASLFVLSTQISFSWRFEPLLVHFPFYQWLPHLKLFLSMPFLGSVQSFEFIVISCRKSVLRIITLFLYSKFNYSITTHYPADLLQHTFKINKKKWNDKYRKCSFKGITQLQEVGTIVVESGNICGITD